MTARSLEESQVGDATSLGLSAQGADGLQQILSFAPIGSIRETGDCEQFRGCLKERAPERGAMVDYLVDGLAERCVNSPVGEIDRDIILIAAMVLDLDVSLTLPRHPAPAPTSARRPSRIRGSAIGTRR